MAATAGLSRPLTAPEPRARTPRKAEHTRTSSTPPPAGPDQTRKGEAAREPGVAPARRLRFRYACRGLGSGFFLLIFFFLICWPHHAIVAFQFPNKRVNLSPHPGRVLTTGPQRSAVSLLIFFSQGFESPSPHTRQAHSGPSVRELRSILAPAGAAAGELHPVSQFPLPARGPWTRANTELLQFSSRPER